MTEHKVRVELDTRSYDILIGPDVLDLAGEKLRAIVGDKRDRVFILSDDAVWPLHGERLLSILEKSGL